MNKPEWYGAKTVFKHTRMIGENACCVFEERVVVFLANDFDHAITKAETEAAKYCSNLDDSAMYLGFVDVYNLAEENINDGVEVYSLMRESNLSDKDYLDSFYDTGKERTRNWEEQLKKQTGENPDDNAC